MGEKQNGSPAPPPAVPSAAEYTDRMRRLSGEVDQLEASLAALINNTRFGRKLRREAGDLRPSLVRKPLEVSAHTVVGTLSAADLLEQLISDPNFGKNPRTYLWTHLGRHPQTLNLIYPAIIEVARTKEKERGVPPATKQKARAIRLVIEHEYELEKYVEWRGLEIQRRSKQGWKK